MVTSASREILDTQYLYRSPYRPIWGVLGRKNIFPLVPGSLLRSTKGIGAEGTASYAESLPVLQDWGFHCSSIPHLRLSLIKQTVNPEMLERLAAKLHVSRFSR